MVGLDSSLRIRVTGQFEEWQDICDFSACWDCEEND
jgi:hypothetical protein